jgi:platelet-activating factor acetylhydrolase
MDTRVSPLRVEQLTFRKHEIYVACAAFRNFVERCDEMALRFSGADQNINLESWRSAVNCQNNVVLMGHSFGGTTVVSHLSNFDEWYLIRLFQKFSMLSTPSPSREYPPIPLNKAIALDPWLGPLPEPGPIPYDHFRRCSNSSVSSHEMNALDHRRGLSQPELLVINSEGFTFWNEHFVRLKSVMKEWAPNGRRLLTIG